MECREARRLLSQGIVPSSSTPERAALGFHLTDCAECRAYRATIQARLLNDLLSQTPDSTERAAPATLESPAKSSRWLRFGALGVLIGVVLIGAILLGRAALAVGTIHSNLQEITLPTSTTQPTKIAATTTRAPDATPVRKTPTATIPRPSATPTPVPIPTASPTATPLPKSEAVTILLLGSDQRPGESDPARTDAIIIARIDPEHRRIALLSLPRDLLVEIPGYGFARINAAHVYGQIYPDLGGGPELARKTVSNFLGIPIDYTITIDFSGFIDAIDSLGGITVNVERELYDSQFPTMDYGYTVAHFLPGPQPMDGATALMYSRIRHPDSDFMRMTRQQAVLIGIMARLREQHALETLERVADVTTALRGYVKTDLPEERIIALAWAMRDTRLESVERYSLNEELITFGAGGDPYAEAPLPGAIETLVAKLMGTS